MAPITTANKLKYATAAGAAGLFTPRFIDFLVAAHDTFIPRIHGLRAKRAVVLERALKHGELPSYLPPSDINTGTWSVPPVPDDLMRPGIEISGPASLTGMFVNALNPGPEGTRAEGDLDDDEDSAGHRFVDTVAAAHNRLAAVERTLQHYDARRDKHYRLQDGQIPFFMHRERGLHLDEPEVTVEGAPVPAAILGTALTLFHAGSAQDRARTGGLFLSTEARVCRGGGLLARLLRFQPGAAGTTGRGDHQGDTAGGVASPRLPDGRGALRPRALRRGAERGTLGPESQCLRVRHG